MSRRIVSILAVALITAVMFGAYAQAAPSPKAKPAAAWGKSTADYYKDHSVSLLVTSTPGGGIDYMARVIASAWANVVGGPMIVQNEPGGNGLVAINKAYIAKPDGLTLCLSETAQVTSSYIVKVPGVKFDPRKFNYLVRAGANPFVFVVAAYLQDVKTIGDLKNIQNLRFTCGEPTGGNAQGSAMILDFWGINGKIAAGLKTAEMGLALARKESQGFVTSSATAGEFINSGFAKKPPLAVFTKTRSDWYKETPTVRELIGSQLTAEQMNLLNYLEANPGDKSIFVGPDVPKDRVAFMQDAMAKIMRDKNFIEQVQKRWPIWTGIQHGKDVPTFIDESMKIPKETLDSVKALLNKYVIR